tara:strand:+ start:133 stop:912 length:780 start_codon:yes stop_codon:yes gene_type:complete
MKTFKQLQESIGKALVKFGAKGLRKAAVKYSPKYASNVSKGVKNLFKPKNADKFTTKVNKIMSKSLEFGKPITKTHKINRELGKNLIAKNQIKNKKGFYATTKPLPVSNSPSSGYQSGVAMSPKAGEIQLQGNLKGGEYKRKLSGMGDKNVYGSVGGSRGSGNKALRRMGRGDEVEKYTRTKPTPIFRKTKAELSTVTKNPSTLKQEPHKWNPGDTYMLSVDINKSKTKSRKVREFIKQNQKRMASIKKGKGPLGISEK